jgi:hypothetical protein
MITNAFANGYDLQQVFDPTENINIDSIIERIAYRSLKHCLDDPKRSSDRDYIYTFAVIPQEIENEFPVFDHIWKRLSGGNVTTVDIINRLQADYSFVFPDRKMRSINILFALL